MELKNVFISFILILNCKLLTCYTNQVTQSKNWPVNVDQPVKFTIAKPYTDKTDLLIEIVNDEVSRKFVSLGKTMYVDASTEYFVLSRHMKKILWSKITITFRFTQKSHNTFLLLRWFKNGADKTNQQLLQASDNLIYRTKVKIRVPWKISMLVEVEEKGGRLQKEERFFHVGKRVKVTCSAVDGLPEEAVKLQWVDTPRGFSSQDYDEFSNTRVGYFQLREQDHNLNISCFIAHNSTTAILRVNHPPSSMSLEPTFTGYTRNGSSISCLPSGGYPTPSVSWSFISVRNFTLSAKPSSLYSISNQRLFIANSAPHGAVLTFNCTVYYTNPYYVNTTTLRRTFAFQIGEAPDKTITVEPIISANQSVIAGKMEALSKAVIGAGVAGVLIVLITVAIVIMLCRSKPKPSRSSADNLHSKLDESPKYAGSLLAGSKSTLKNQIKSQHNGASAASPETAALNPLVEQQQHEFTYDDMPRGRRPIHIVEDPVVYSTIVGTMQPKPARPSLDIGPIDRV